MAVTMEEIAKAAGVSRGTVDRALHDRPGVSAKSADRIKKLSTQLDYKPNVAGRILSNKNLRKRIGVITNSENNPFYIPVFQGMQTAIDEISGFGFEVSRLTAAGFDVERQLWQIEKLVQGGIDALVFTPINSPKIISRINRLSARGMPIVTINTGLNAKHMIYVGCDYEMSGETAGGLMGMMSVGRECRVGVITGSEDVEAHFFRVRGFCKCLAKEFPNVMVMGVRENNDRDDLAYEYVKEFLTCDEPANAIFLAAAGQAGVIQALDELQMTGKVLTVMYDLTPVVVEGLWSGAVSAAITQDPFQQGYRPIRILYDYFVHSIVPEEKKIYTDVAVKLKYNIACDSRALFTKE